MEKMLDLTGALTATAFYLFCLLVFISRLLNRPRVEYYIGLLLICLVVPLLFLLFQAHHYSRPGLYYLQIGLVIGYLAVELVLDYILKLEFRSSRPAVIAYVTLFFAAAGGLIGVASRAGKIWTAISIPLFLAVAFLAFYQRKVTGM